MVKAGLKLRIATLQIRHPSSCATLPPFSFRILFESSKIHYTLSSMRKSFFFSVRMQEKRKSWTKVKEKTKWAVMSGRSYSSPPPPLTSSFELGPAFTHLLPSNQKKKEEFVHYFSVSLVISLKITLEMYFYNPRKCSTASVERLRTQSSSFCISRICLCL